MWLRRPREHCPGLPVSHPRTADLGALLTALTEAGIDFIVVGGAAAVLHGAPVTTQDLDIVHRRSDENVRRLLEVLERLDALFRGDLTGQGLRPSGPMLGGKGHLLLSSTLGPIDILCEIDGGKGHEELLDHTELFTDEHLSFRVLDLPTLIAVKTRLGRAKDRLMLPVLIATLEERSRRG